MLKSTNQYRYGPANGRPVTNYAPVGNAGAKRYGNPAQTNPLKYGPDDAATRELYLGQVATKTLVPNALAAAPGFQQSMSRTNHFARDDITAIAVAVPQWYITGAGDETAITGTATCKIAIEYPIGGTPQLVTWGGADTGSVASGTTGVSDLTTLLVPIPSGAQFAVRHYRVCAAGGVPFLQYSNAVMGDGFEFGASVTDKTLSGTVTSSSSNNCHPVAILAMTRKASIMTVGDSRDFANPAGTASGVVFNATGDSGEIAQAVGAQFGYIKTSNNSTRAVNFVASTGLRAALAAYVTDVVVQIGINDITAPRTQAQVEASIQSIVNMFPTKRVWLTTKPPVSTGAWTLVNLSDQTVAASNPVRIAINTDIRTGFFTGVSGFFEITGVVESSLNSGKWMADGTPQKYTNDGVHENQFSFNLIQNSGAINLSLFT